MGKPKPPTIPVRDGLRFRSGRLPRRAILPDVGHQEYRAGWRWGFVCGAAAAGILGGIVAAIVHKL